MNIKMIVIITLTLLCTFNSMASDRKASNNKTTVAHQVKAIKVAVSVYPLDKNIATTDYKKVLKTSKPESAPTLLALSGQPAIIQTSLNNNETIKISFLANKSASKFDMDIELNNGVKKSLTQVSQLNIGRSVVFLAKLNNIAKLIKVTTKLDNAKTVDENGVKANDYLKVSKKLSFIFPSQQYIQANKVWQHDNKLKRAARQHDTNSSVEQNFNFIYLKNKSSDHIIKGILKIKNNFNSLISNSSGVSSSSHGSLNNVPKTDISTSHKSEKDTLLPFYILPNKTVFIGKYAFGSKVELFNASYLSKSEDAAIKSLKESE